MSMGMKNFQPKLLVNFSLDQMIPENHILRRISNAIDFTFVRGLVRDTYSRVGQPSIDPVVIFKMMLLGYLYNTASMRKVAERCQYDLSWRWFLGYEIDESTPHHCVISEAQIRYGPAPIEQFFQRTVELCEKAGLIAGDVLYLDATMSRANASLQSMRQRGVAEQLVPVRQFVEDMWVANEEGDDVKPPRSKKPRGSGLKPSGKPPRKSERKANAELVSDTDPDAEMFRKEGVPRKLYHKTHFGTDPKNGVVTSVLVRPATEHDSRVLATMLEKHKKAVGSFPQAAVGDKGYDSEAAVTACVSRDVLPLLMQKKLGNSQAEKKRDDFVYDPSRDVFSCSGGHELKPWAENFQRQQTQYRPPLRACESCEHKPSCAPGKADRTLTRSWKQERKTTVSAILKTPTVKSLLRRRSEIAEKSFADGKVRHCLGRSRCRGTAKMWMQAALTGAAMNIRKLTMAPAVSVQT